MEQISNCISEFKFKSPFMFNGLKLYPISFKSKSLKDYVLLDDCFDQNLVEVFELSSSGDVQNIVIRNNNEKNLLIIDGEAIIGAKQNRIAQTTIVIAPKTEKIIPVNCVEKGRWSNTTDLNFKKSDFSISPKMRDKKAELIKNQEFNKIQSEIWKEVDDLSDKLNSSSNTDDLGEVLSNLDSEIFHENHFKLYKEDCNGYLVFGTERPFIEIFNNKYIKSHHLKKSINSWCADLKQNFYDSVNPEIYKNKFLNAFFQDDISVGIEDCYKTNDKSNARAFLLNNALIHSYYFF